MTDGMNSNDPTTTTTTTTATPAESVDWSQLDNADFSQFEVNRKKRSFSFPDSEMPVMPVMKMEEYYNDSETSTIEEVYSGKEKGYL